MNLKEIMALIEPDMRDVEKIREQLLSNVDSINKVGNYIIGGGGKRIRPIIVMLVARALNYKTEHITLAALIEFIHTATLLHDDVVDGSDMRRGKKSANVVFGNAKCVLVGDFIYTRSFQMMVNLKSPRILELISKATSTIAEGEVSQLENRNNPDLTEESYMQVIYKKTACLFEAASQSSAILAKASREKEQALQDYGRHLGTAFQLMDDYRDYNTDVSTLGKNPGDDLNEGKPTLPLLRVMQAGTAEQSDMIRQVIKQGNSRGLLKSVRDIMQQCDALNYTCQRAQEEAKKAIDALEILPKTPHKTALISLAELVAKQPSSQKP